MKATSEFLRSQASHCPGCHKAVSPIRPPFPARRWAVWAGLTAAALLNSIALWAVIGFILWRNSKAICPECRYDPIKGNVGWTRESIILWLLLVTCFIISSWFTFWITMAVMWMFNPVLH